MLSRLGDQDLKLLELTRDVDAHQDGERRQRVHGAAHDVIDGIRPTWVRDVQNI